MAREDEMARRLSTTPRIGVINATALVATVGDARSFGRGRDLATSLRLTISIYSGFICPRLGKACVGSEP